MQLTLKVYLFLMIDTFQYVGVSILVFEVGPTILPIRESMYDK